MVEETTLIEEIQWNSTKEQEVIQELAKKYSQSWEDNSIVYVEGRIYIPNNKKIMTLWILDIQNNKGYSNWSKRIICGQESRMMWRTMFRDILNVNRIKYNIGKRLENFIYWKFYKDYSKKLVLISLDHYHNQKEKMLLWW